MFSECIFHFSSFFFVDKELLFEFDASDCRSTASDRHRESDVFYRGRQMDPVDVLFEKLRQAASPARRGGLPYSELRPVPEETPGLGLLQVDRVDGGGDWRCSASLSVPALECGLFR